MTDELMILCLPILIAEDRPSTGDHESYPKIDVIVVKAMGMP